MKGKLADATGVSLHAAVDDARQDIANALIALGYNEKESAAAMKQLPADIGTSDGIRQALKLLSRSDDPGSRSQTAGMIALVVLLIIGCVTVLLPFVGALLFAFVLWICTWRFYADQLAALSAAAITWALR